MDDIINLGTRVTHDGVNHNVALKANALCTHAVVVGASGSGKCLAPNTKVMLFTGQLKAAKDVVVGDQLMGPNSQPRTVVSTVAGIRPMYRVTPIKGEAWECTDTHILTLVHSSKHEVCDISVLDYLAANNNFRNLHKQYFSAVDFPPQEECTIDPYFLGVWFGDGSKRLKGVNITKPDAEIQKLCENIAVQWGVKCTQYADKDSNCPTYNLVMEGVNTRIANANPLLTALRDLVGTNATIPESVRLGSRDTRKAFLAGFLDTDGHLQTGCFEIAQKRKDYALTIQFIAKSLGLQAQMSAKVVNGVVYHRLSISGDFTNLPMRIARKKATKRLQIKNVTRTGITVEPIGLGEYAGFTLTGDGRFLLGDFTVTHNSGAVIGMVEELVRLGIPTFLVDVKGDIANVALQPEDVRDRMAIRFLTPGGTHGEAVNIFSGIENPDRITSTVSTIFKLINSKQDVTSTQHTFLSNIIQWRLKAKKPCTIVDILNDVADPPFEYLGMLPLEEVFPAASRGKLASKLNNLLAAPSFQAWREGVAINIPRLLECAPGKVPVVVYSVAHLVDDTERIFAISMFLEEMQSWMRLQPGTKELKVCLMLDEMYGVMPPHPYNPPTKKPLLTMIKQGRAHGLGIVICSQNPMDLDYKGMSNAQTWFVGRLQTANDRARVVNGICASTAQDSRLIETSIARLQPRQFLLVRPAGTAIFTTRDCSAELRGPMNPMEIKKLFTSGIAEEVMSKQLLELHLENARAKFEREASDANWAAVEFAQKNLEAYKGAK